MLFSNEHENLFSYVRTRMLLLTIVKLNSEKLKENSRGEIIVYLRVGQATTDAKTGEIVAQKHVNAL